MCDLVGRLARVPEARRTLVGFTDELCCCILELPWHKASGGRDLDIYNLAKSAIAIELVTLPNSIAVHSV